MIGRRAEFERVWPWLAAAIQRYGNTHEKEDLWKVLEAGDAQLFPLPNGAFCTTVQTYPTGLKECHFWLAGGNLEELVKVEPLTLKWVKSIGCDRVSIRGRKGWVRALPGYEDVGTILVKEVK